MTTHEKEYKSYYSGLTEIASNAVIFWALSKKLEQIKAGEIEKYQEVESFIDAILLSSRISFITQVNKLVDSSGFSIYDIVKYIEKYPLIFNSSKEKSQIIAREVKEKLRNHDPLIKRLKEHRDRFHSHIDSKDIKESIHKVFSEYEVTFEELESLLESICLSIESLNSLISDFLGEPFVSRFIIAREVIYDFINLNIVLEKLKK